jgi:hypothetical protein
MAMASGSFPQQRRHGEDFGLFPSAATVWQRRRRRGNSALDLGNVATGGSSRGDSFVGRRDLGGVAVAWLSQTQSTFWRVVVGGIVWRVAAEGESPPAFGCG